MSPKTFAFLAAGLFSATMLHPAAAIECWTNSDGFRECGNVVPPEYAQGQVNTLNDRGLTVEVKERAQSREELAKERRREAEEERRRAKEAVRQEEQKRHDRVLLLTFTTEEELIASGDRKAAAIEATVEVTKSSISSTQKALQKHQQRAATLKQRGQPVPERLQEDIVNLKKQIADKQEYVDNELEEKAALNQKNQDDLERFRYLKNQKR